MKRNNIVEGLSSNPAVTVSLIGIISFCVLRIAYAAYYAKYGISPEVAGLGYIPTLVRQTSPATIIVLGAAAVIILLRGRLLNRVASEVEEKEQSINRIDGNLQTLISLMGGGAVSDMEAARRRVTELEAARTRLNGELTSARTREAEMYQKGRRYFLIAFLMLAIWVGVLISEASTAEVGERHPSWIRPFQVDVESVNLILTDAGMESKLAGYLGHDKPQWLFLGNNAGRLVLYDLVSRRLVVLPGDAATLVSR